MLFTMEVTVLPDWVDYNGHMADHAYGLVFSHAGNAYLEHHHLGAAYLKAEKATFYTLENRIGYFKECYQGDKINVSVQLIGLDKKRVRFLLEMKNKDNEVLALSEQWLMHVSQASGTPKAMSMSQAVFECFEPEFERHKTLPKPRWLNRRMGLQSK
ncbi:thioesterase family protein [Paenochrobactrum pullorum]|uniref:thioesterase family protein n=1 Tax=Paenochrobactrum pullorum TaxID=1324351 RepID=UPI0035BC2735